MKRDTAQDHENDPKNWRIRLMACAMILAATFLVSSCVSTESSSEDEVDVAPAADANLIDCPVSFDGDDEDLAGADRQWDYFALLRSFDGYFDPDPDAETGGVFDDPDPRLGAGDDRVIEGLNFLAVDGYISDQDQMSEGFIS